MIAKHSSIFLIVTILLTMLFGGCDKSAQDAERMISSSEALTDLDLRCSKIPKPDSFQFLRKDVSGNAWLDIIEYRFSSQMPFDSVKEFYSKWFHDHDWHSDSAFDSEKLKELDFPVFFKEDVSISIGHAPFPGADYLISCSRKR